MPSQTAACNRLHTMDLAAGQEPTIWLAVAGSHTAREEAAETLRLVLAEANYGRVGAQHALRYMQAMASLIDLEQPGALPELAPSPDYDPFVDLTERMMFIQAWATYGINWTIVRCLLGVDADIPAGRLSVVPQIPPPWPGLAAKRLRLGQGCIAVSGERDGHRFRTSVEAPAGLRLTIGHTLPAGLAIEAVMLDDALAEYEVVDTLRGREVRVETVGGAPHTLIVLTADRDSISTLEPERSRALKQRE
jgi:hypothetical protein